MNTRRAARFLPEPEPNHRFEEQTLEDIAGEPLEGSGFETELPEEGFEERD